MDLKILPKTVQLETIKKLREAIMWSHFKPGERLVEANLCKQLGVSRTSVREALRVLSAEKLIVIIPNKGPSVAQISWNETEQIYRVRALLEGEAAALAAGRISDEDIDRMRHAFAEFKGAVKASDAAARINATADFYEVIIRGSGNQVIGDVLHGLLARINFLRARTMSSPGRAKHSVKELAKICDAIARHDARGARAAAREHVQAACEKARNVVHQISQTA